MLVLGTAGLQDVPAADLLNVRPSASQSDELLIRTRHRPCIALVSAESCCDQCLILLWFPSAISARPASDLPLKFILPRLAARQRDLMLEQTIGAWVVHGRSDFG